MVDFDGAPYSRSNCYLMGSKSHPKFSSDTAIFGITLQLYTLKVNKYTTISACKFITIFALQ